MVRKKPQHKKFGHQRHEHKNKYAKFSHAEKRLAETLARENSASEGLNFGKGSFNRKSYESLSSHFYYPNEYYLIFPSRRKTRDLPYFMIKL